MTKSQTKTMRLHPDQHAALVELFRLAGCRGKQPGTHLNAGLRGLADAAQADMERTAAMMAAIINKENETK